MLLPILFLACQPPPDLSVENANSYPLRIAQGPARQIYVSDATAGSVFIYGYDPSSSTPLAVEQEIKGIGQPLGIAVDRHRRIFVGNNERDCVEVFNQNRFKIRDIGLGTIQMPTDIAVTRAAAKIFIADSLSDTIWVYRPDGTFIQSISTWWDGGEQQLKFPAAVMIAKHNGVDELYVSDQGNGRIVVFSLDGTFLRSFGSKLEMNSDDWQGKFGKVQSLEFDAQERLHVVDTYLNLVQVLDPDNGSFLGAYGTFGTGAGEFNVPLDIVITSAEEVLITNSGNARIERFPEVPTL